MKFTVVFPSHESWDVSIGVVFTPCLVWKRGTRELLNPHRDIPYYKRGDLQYFFETTGFKKHIATHSNKVAIVIHPTGHGSKRDLDNLLNDLQDEGFEPVEVYL